MKKILLSPFALLLALFAMGQTPVAYYPFTGNANDAAGTNHGTVNGAVLTTDRFGNANSAYSFDGVDDDIIMTTVATTQTDKFSISVWVKPATLNQFAYILNNGNGNNGYGLLQANGGGGSGNTVTGIYHNVTYLNSGEVIATANTWYHIAMVRSSGTTRFYLNGNNTGFANTTTPNTPVGQLTVGVITGVLRYSGSIDEVKIFNTALTAAQVQQQYNQTNNSSQFNNSVKMNGTTDAITLPINAAINFGTGNFAVEFWYKSPANSREEIIFEKRDDNCADGKLWAIRKKSSNTIDFEVNVPNSPTAYAVTVANPFDNNWHHLAFSRNGTQMEAHKDGILVSSLTTATVEDVSNTANLSISTGPCSQFIPTGGFYTGSLDEVRIWNTSRTQAQIVANMNTQLTGSEAGLVGYWDMNRNGQGAGLTVDNKATITGAALNGTTIGTASTPIFEPAVTQQKPGSGNAISFDGGNDFVVAPHSSNIDFSLNDNFSIDFWLKIPIALQTNTEGPDNMIIEKWEDGSPFIPYPFIFRYYNHQSPDNGQIRFGRYNGSSGSSVISAVTLNDNKWHHITGVKNGTLLLFYVDGMLTNTASDIPTGSTNNNHNLYFGSRGGAGYFLNGSLDEVRIWNAALTQSQIRDRMCHKITSSDALYTNLVAYYNFDESTGNTVFDGTVNANDGTLTNSPTRVTSGAAIGNASSHDYVNAIKTTSITHPTGESFTVTSTSGSPDGIQVYRVDEKPNTLSGSSGVGANDKYFGVFQVNGTSPQYTAVYNYNGNPNVNAGNENQLRLNKRSDNAGTSWTTMAAIPNEPANTITVTGESTEYILGKLGLPLPLNLISFSGSKQNNDALLQWKTANETGVSKFEVQRSNDGQTFVTIGTVSAGGSLYSLTDANTFSSRTVAFYRLKSIDVDARFTYSNIIKLSKQTSAALTVYPNPVSDVLTINGLKQNGTVLLYSAEGKLLQHHNISAQTMTMDMSKYAKGIYLVQYKTEDEVVSQKIIKQ